MMEVEFITVAVSDYCKTTEGDIIPAELSLVRATLESGIVEEYHVIINREYDL